MHYHISLKISYIKAVCINGIEYVNVDYKPPKSINLGIPYIASININGTLFKNQDYQKKRSS